MCRINNCELDAANHNPRCDTISHVEDPPVQNVRILNQEGLDSFFEGYDQFAEFVVDLRRIEEGGVQQND